MIVTKMNTVGVTDVFCDWYMGALCIPWTQNLVIMTAGCGVVPDISRQCGGLILHVTLHS
jgi:hypothetical protein